MNNVDISKVYLLSVPLENDYKNTLYFTSLSEQNNYFASKVVKSYTNFSYLRKDNLMYVPAHFDTIFNVNYVMYQNSKYNNKWFYAFVKNIKYENDECTIIEIETDVIQTWLFDYTIKPSFVEREHVSDDTVGKHTVIEGLETGEYIVNSTTRSNIGNAHVVIATTWNFKEKKESGSYINGIYHGVDYILVGPTSATSVIKYILGIYADEGKSDAITGLFMVPDTLTNYNNVSWDYLTEEGGLSWGQYKFLQFDSSNAVNIGATVIYKPLDTINGYTPRNKKLFTFPYQYLNASNNSGGNAIYKYEYFSANPFSFNVHGVITPGCSIKGYPRLYKGCDDNYDEGLNLGKYPICSYSTDMYTNWLTQNSVNIGLQIASGVGQIIAGGAIALGSGGLGTAVGGGSIVGGVSTIANTLAQVHQQSLVPPQAEGNLNCGDVNYSLGINDFIFYKMSIKQETAKIIDKYFDMFGYKVNLVKTPNKAHRSRWWYTKTIDINIDGNIPQDDMQKIKNAYDNGITFWRNATEINNYELTNGIAITEGAVTE